MEPRPLRKDTNAWRSFSVLLSAGRHAHVNWPCQNMLQKIFCAVSLSHCSQLCGGRGHWRGSIQFLKHTKYYIKEEGAAAGVMWYQVYFNTQLTSSHMLAPASNGKKHIFSLQNTQSRILFPLLCSFFKTSFWLFFETLRPPWRTTPLVGGIFFTSPFLTLYIFALR